MEDERFSWDDAKAASNIEKHEVSFEEAAKALDDASRSMSARATKGSGRKATVDPENPPLTQDECDGMRPVPLASLVRDKLRLSREQFATAYGIPLDKLAAWERRTAEPNEVEAAYLRLIEREPERAKLVPA